MSHITVLTARTTFPNTAETDKMPQVWHTVSYSTDDNLLHTAYVLASDPQNAIRQLQYKQFEDVQGNYNIKPESN